MIVDHRISILRLLKIIWLRLLLIFLVAAVTILSLVYFDLSKFAIDRSIPQIFGTAIAIFLGFRTNSAYERWWEARRLWGAILNDSLNLGRQVRDFTITEPSNQEDRDQTEGCSLSGKKVAQEVCYRQIAWAHVLNRQLKGAALGREVEDFLDATDYQEIQRLANPTWHLLLKQSESLATAYRSGRFDSMQNRVMQDTLSRLTEHMGGCNRIRNTNFPTHYSYFTRVFIWMFLILLGLSLPSYQGTEGVTDGLVALIGIPAVVLIGWVFFMIDGIGSYMQSPFEDNRNVIPMEALTRQIEIGLRMALDETNIPEPLQPSDGVLL